MFGGPPPPPSKAELEAQEQVANMTVASAAVTCVLLYLSPFAVDYVKKLV
ncbi:hypothetical protein C1H76_8405 [Elsinoe australis]|uniref:Mitochondrial outer membrane translocase complex, subunit Tom5 n=1 Tax=Elsinoe australis TaxID=40998 RepID=A0A2P7ZAN5_9PEZI|nr:hypothetical protein B9Z65_2395 [Elsinoe australis]TKX19556.1 hypothetical protein C1H76_8405 [Elsinoe australis]